MSNPTAYIGMAAIFALRKQRRIMGLPDTRAGLSELFESVYKWRADEAVTQRMVLQLEAWKCVTITTDKYAGELFKLYAATADETLERLSDGGHADLVSKARSGGEAWFGRVFENKDFWADLHNDPLPEIAVDSAEQDPLDLIPASDRIVSRTDNQAEVEILHSDLKNLVDEIDTNNEVSVELGGNKEIIQGELKAADVLVSQPAFRLSRLSSLVLPVLRFLAEKFATGAIGEMAKRIIQALIGLM